MILQWDVVSQNICVKYLCKMTCKQANNICSFTKAKLTFVELFAQWEKLVRLMHCVDISLWFLLEITGTTSKALPGNGREHSKGISKTAKAGCCTIGIRIATEETIFNWKNFHTSTVGFFQFIWFYFWDLEGQIYWSI